MMPAFLFEKVMCRLDLSSMYSIFILRLPDLFPGLESASSESISCCNASIDGGKPKNT